MKYTRRYKRKRNNNIDYDTKLLNSVTVILIKLIVVVQHELFLYALKRSDYVHFDHDLYLLIE